MGNQVEECFFAALVKIGFKGTAFVRMAKVLSVELAHYRGQGALTTWAGVSM